MRHSPLIPVTCDTAGCGETLSVPIRNAKGSAVPYLVFMGIRNAGWKVIGGQDFCPRCSEEMDAMGRGKEMVKG